MLSFDEMKEKCFRSFEESIHDIKKTDMAPSDVQMGEIQKLKGNFYVAYPFLFESHYTNIDKEALEKLALAGNIYFTYLLTFDELFDGDAKSSAIVVAHLLHEHAINLLYEMFPAQSPFWSLFKKYENEFLCSVTREYNAIKKIMEGKYIDDNDLIMMVRNRSSFAKCATAGLWVLSGCKGESNAFDKTQEFFHVGLQMLDDLKDWKDDYRKKRPSYLLSLALSDERILEALNRAQSDDYGVLGRGIYYSGIAENLLQTAKNFFIDALKSCEPYNVPQWKMLVENHIKEITNACNDLRETKLWLLEKREKVRIIHSGKARSSPNMVGLIANTPYRQTLLRGLSFLQIEQKHDYPEMTHRMALPRFDKNNSGNSFVVCSNLFQRTVVLDIFIDLKRLLNGAVDKKIISAELSILETSKARLVRGGWSYFPNYPWLPPDADDLAQMIQIFVKTAHPRIHELVEEPIKLLIDSNRFPDGTFRTWILDPNDNSEIQQVLKKTVETHWGERYGKDIEVTTNMLYALLVYNKERYHTIISKGIAAVLAAQAPNGLWHSGWYWGPFYGTYVATRLLSSSRFKTESLQITKDYLINNQHNDGGWGYRQSDPLNTALSILTLKNIEDANHVISHEIYERAISYLSSEQKVAGSWRQVPFIKMLIGRKEITYQSETITTAYVLKALASIMFFMK